MAADRYVKMVLTVIAASLLWLCAIGVGRPVQAQQGPALTDGRPQPVVIVGWGTVDAQGRVTLTMGGDRRNPTTDPNIPVNIVALPAPIEVQLEYTESRPLPVGISSIKQTGPWDPIRSSVDEEPVRSRPGRR
jgi:hypothetical protein